MIKKTKPISILSRQLLLHNLEAIRQHILMKAVGQIK